MAARQSPTRKKGFPIFATLGALAVIGIILAVGGFGFAASQETHDPFCASCHTQPESTFFQRSTSAQPVDLASYHTTQETRCIDCHSAPGLTGRMQAELMGARNAVAWYLNAATQPAPLTHPIQDVNCLKCHQDVTQRNYVPKQAVTIPGARGGEGEGGEEGRANHWHAFLTRWQAADPNAGSCTSCHSGHSTSGSAQTGFQDTQTTRDTCDACHRVLRNEGD